LTTIRPMVMTGQRRADIFSCRIGMSIGNLLFQLHPGPNNTFGRVVGHMKQTQITRGERRW
jgi:hypothetical protein